MAFTACTQVLLLLLTGSTVEDEEATRFVAADADLYVDLCHDLSAHLRSAAFSTPESVVQDMKDVLILFIQRRNLEYRDDFVYILTSIYLYSRSYVYIPKSICSAIFYSLATSFMPLVGLQYAALETATDAVHRFFYILCRYHAPALCVHLDKVSALLYAC